MTTTTPDPTALEAERARIRSAHLKPTGERPASTARGLHHTALISSDVEHEVHSGVSVYFRDPDGARIELIADPLGEMYGHHVL
jgi:catechol 2,3-dioxygenase-like lactoylglutathione lyase family enzyme